MKPWQYILTGFGVAAAILIAFLIDQRHPKEAQTEPLKPRVDTLVTQDSSTYAEPQNEPKPRVITKEIPVPVYVVDSVAIDSLLNECARLERRGDSLQLILLREQKHYSDSTYDAWVSGIDPKLDSIRTYQTTMTITKEIPVIQVKKTRWGIGVQAGFGAYKDGLTPYFGVGISYNLLSW